MSVLEHTGENQQKFGDATRANVRKEMAKGKGDAMPLQGARQRTGPVEKWGKLHVGPKGSEWRQYVVAGREELGFAVNDQRKNRRSHLSQRNGLTKIRARILSIIPLRLDWWRRSLVHCGQFTITMLLTIERQTMLKTTETMLKTTDCLERSIQCLFSFEHGELMVCALHELGVPWRRCVGGANR